MTDEMTCEEVRDLAGELALGIAGAEERDLALRHFGGCLDCRRTLGELSAVADELLLLAPVAEPPNGFGQRTLARLGERSLPRRRRMPMLLAAAAVVIAALLGASWTLHLTSADRQLAASYRALLTQAGGSSFVVAPLVGDAGRVGTAFGYQGHPTWMYVTLSRAGAEQTVIAQLLTRGGAQIELGETALGGHHAAWGSEIPVDLADVRTLRFLDPSGAVVFSADLVGSGAVVSGWTSVRGG